MATFNVSRSQDSLHKSRLYSVHAAMSGRYIFCISHELTFMVDVQCTRYSGLKKDVI